MIQRLGWTLLHFFWQGTAIAVAYAVLRSLLGRSLSPQGRYALACMALMTMTVAPPLTFLVIPDALGTGSWTMSQAEWQRLLAVVVALWLLGVLIFSIRLLGGWRFTSRLRSASHPAAAEWRQTLERIAARVGATKPVHLLVSSLVDVPTVIGWLRPAILVPVGFFTGLSIEHITALLAHEMAHIRRHDYLASILQNIVEAVLFYHPAVWWVSEQIRAERELCCDDLAVAATGDVLAYARALAELESRQPARLTPALAANGGSLVNRVRRLMDPAHTTANNLPGPGAAWAMTLLWLAGIGVAAVHGAQTPAARVVKPIPAPAPSPMIVLAAKARHTLLYDPVVPSPQPAPPRHDDALVPSNAGLLLPPPPEIAVTAKPIDGVLPALVIGAAQQLQPEPSPEPPPAPTFRATAKLVQVDVIARSNGAPATGFSREDFTLLDNGKPQKVALFSVTSSQTARAASGPLPAGAVSNRLELANATVLLIDQRNTAQTDQAFALQRIAKFLRTRRNPHRMGIYAFGKDGLQAVQEITDDAELLSRAADHLKTQDPSRVYDDRMGMDAKHVLEAVARHLESVPGRKGLIWVTAGFPLTTESFDFNPDMEEAARALNDADVALYAVDARGLVGALSGTTGIFNAEHRGVQPTQQLPWAADLLPGTDTMAKLAGLTGGLALYNTNGIEDSIQKALDDAELTYTLGFYPAEGEQDGVWHKLKIAVARPGVKMRYRGKYFASGTLAGTNERPTLPQLLKVPLDATQLRLVAQTAPDRARPGFCQLRLSVDLHNVHLENRNNTWMGAVDVAFSVQGSGAARTIARNLEIPDAQLAAALMKGIVFDDSIGVVSPAGELRIVAQDRATGAAGSVTVALGNR